MLVRYVVLRAKFQRELCISFFPFLSSPDYLVPLLTHGSSFYGEPAQATANYRPFSKFQARKSQKSADLGDFFHLKQVQGGVLLQINMHTTILLELGFWILSE